MSDDERDRAQDARIGGRELRELLAFWRRTNGRTMFFPAPGGTTFDELLVRDARARRLLRDVRP